MGWCWRAVVVPFRCLGRRVLVRKMSCILPFRCLRGLGVAFFILFAGACVYDWESYDPRLVPSAKPPLVDCDAGDVKACFGAAAAKRGVGVCRAGEQRCVAGKWGPCEGEVLPTAEDCDVRDDDDCDGDTTDVPASCSCDVGSTAACYSGPAGTEGQGRCVAGIQLCDVTPTGPQFGMCLAEVLPINERCDTIDDDDCDGVSNDHCATFVRRFSSGDYDHPRAIAAGAGGSILVGGDYTGPLPFDAIVLPKDTDLSGFVARLNAAGTALWATQIAGTGAQSVHAVVEDAAGSVYIAGQFEGQLVLSGLATLQGAGALDAFVAKLDGVTGAPLWSYRVGGADNDVVNDIAVDTAGNIWVAGYFHGTVNFGDGSVTAVDGERDGYYTVLDPAGMLLGKGLVAGVRKDEVIGLAPAPDGGMYMVGYYDQPLSIGGTPLVNAAGQDGFVAKMSDVNTSAWVRTMAGPDNDAAVAISVSSVDASVVVTGRYRGSVDVGQGDIEGTSVAGLFVAKYTQGGAATWGRGFADTAPQSPVDVVVDSAGAVFVAGSLSGRLVFGDSVLRSAANDDMFLVNMTKDGVPQWARQFGSVRDHNLRSMTMYNDQIAIAAECSGPIDFGTGVVASFTSRDDVCVVWY